MNHFFIAVSSQTKTDFLFYEPLHRTLKNVVLRAIIWRNNLERTGIFLSILSSYLRKLISRFLGFLSKFLEDLFCTEHLDTEASVCVKRQNFENYILGKSQVSSVWPFLRHLHLRADSDPSVNGWKLFVKEGWKNKQANTLCTLTAQRQDFADLGYFIFSLDFLVATNTDLLCILLLSTDCFLYNAIKKSCKTHHSSRTIMLQLSKLTELQPRVLEFSCNLTLPHKKQMP